ncbi:MAG: amino acid adenylation domain-containing protein [Pyrinomonadaceae bacterium]
MEETNVSQLSPVKRALLRLEELEAQLAAAEHARTEPIAVIGMGCRFPGGADSPEAYWRLLRDGADAVTEVPPARWDVDEFYDPDPERPGKMYTRHGGFLSNVDRFDAPFFRISPREAAAMDPQQRLLLQVSWEALEDAQIPPDSLHGTATGVFVGVTTNDYAQLQMLDGGQSRLDGYFFTGNPLNAMAGRVSYFLGLHGPSLALDTACSSSLVSIHQACQSLRAGECDVALAGGVNLILSPATSIAVSCTRALAPDGRSKTFDAAADGFVRSEGCGVVVLKKLSDALAAGDRILAVVRGSAVNHDGASGGFTAPNGKAQEAVIRRALGGLAPAEVDYVEAHGTGTALGDPIEVRALAAVYGGGRRGKLRIGSVKTNIGHAESAAGVAGVIKVILALRHDEIPAHLHFNNPSPLIPWADIPIEVTKETTPWPPNGRRRLAGVSAFGASGVNAHLVIEEAPAQTWSPVSGARPLHPLVLSAKSESALKELAGRYAELLRSDASPGLELVSAAAARGRSHLKHRLAVVAADDGEAAQKLTAFVTGQAERGVHSGNSEGAALPRTAFLFTGQGSQYQNMGRALYDAEPVFRQAVGRCAQIASPRLDASLLDVIYPPGESPPLIDQTAYCQPAFFTLQYALVELLKSWGVRPDAVMGHSVGEYAAACAAGVFSLEEGLGLVCERARLMQALPGGGAMAAVFVDERTAAEAIEPHAGRLSVAAINGPRHTVISGEQEALASALAALARVGVEARRLNVSHAFHSRLLEPMLDEFEAAAARVSFNRPSLTLVSNLTGAVMTAAPDARYWREHGRRPVLFASGMTALFADGFDAFIEIGPRPVLTGLARACSPPGGRPLLASMLAPGAEWETALEALSKLYARGAEIDWRGFHRGRAGAPVPLPTYPFQGKRYWFKEGIPAVQIKQSAAATEVKKARRDEILEEVRASVAALIQADVSEVNVRLPFLEMGADSLVLVEAIREIENRYGLKLAIRRFFEDLSTVEAVADFIAANLPEESPAADGGTAGSGHSTAETTSAPSEPAPMPPHFTGTAANVSGIEQVLIEQNRTISTLLTQQMALLRETLGQRGTAVPAAEMPRPAAAPKPTRAAARLTEPAAAVEEKSAPLLPWGTPAEKRAQGLSPAQQKHLEDLIERYCRRTRRSKESAQRHRASLADSRATVGFRFSTKEMLYPIVGERSRGARLWDIDGNEYIDFTMGFGVHLFGHTPPFVNEAVAEEFGRGVELGARSDLVGEVAERFARVTGHDRVAFSNSGTEAVMAAVRLARARTGRDKLVIFNHSYHGHSDGTLAAARRENGLAVTYPVAPGVPGGVVESVVVLDYGTAETLDTIRALGDELAAVLVEPVQSRNPSLQPAEFLREVRAITEACGAALIIDEMITGFRVHPAGAQGLFGVQADLACYGKIIGGGLPLGLVAGKSRFMDGIDGGMWSYGDHTFPAAERTAFGGTFCQHPLAMAAARAVLRKVEEEGPALQERLNERTARLADRLNLFFEAEQVSMRVTYFGSMFRFEFSTNLDLFFYHMLEQGIYIWEWRTCFLSTAHTDEDLDAFVKAVEQSVTALRSGGFIAPARPATAAAHAGHNGSAPTRRARLTEAQKQLWLLSRIDPEGSLAYNVNTTIGLKGGLDTQKMLAAVARLSERHEALRTTVAPDGEAQVIHAHLPPETRLLDYSSLPADERERAVARCRLAESEEAFDLSKRPLFRALLIRLAPEQHILSLTAHHVICDGMTMGVLLEELTRIYAGGGGLLPEPMQFPEYAELCARQSATPEMRAHRDYWLERCADELPASNLPTDRPRPAMKSYRGGRVSISVGPELAGLWRGAARRNGCTLFMFLLGSFEYTLARYSGQQEVVTGIPVTGRPFPGSERLVGYCTHLLPLRAGLASGTTVAEFLRQTRTALLDALDHQDFPFAELIQHLGRRGDAGLSPVVSTVFNLEPVAALPALPGLELELLEPVVRFTAFDLSVNVFEAGEELLINCDYNTDLFDRETVERLLNVYQTAARAMAEAPESIASCLPIVPESDRRLLNGWNATAEARPAPVCIHELFEAQAVATPDRTALICGETRISYGELNARAERLADELAGLGVGPEVLVGVCAERGPELVVALLAVLKAGGAYVPMDPAYPKTRLQFMAEDAAVNILLTHSRAAADLPQSSARVVEMDAAPAAPPAARATRRAARPDNLAYVIYTSGSTGRPQGVGIEHRNAAEFLHWVRSYFTDEQMACVLASSSVCFDLSIFEIFGTLGRGGSVVLAENALGLPQLPAAGEVTLVNTVPSVMGELLRAGGLPPSVGTVTLAGEPLGRELVDQIYEAGAVAAVYNLYGPSEDTTYSTATLVARDEGHRPSIGRPLPNTKTYILGRGLEPLPPGAAGELFIAGAGLARGYLNNPARTAERFLPDPFSKEAGARMYRTGDLARHRADGQIEFLGRADHQLKLRGFRIEPGETEAILASHAWVDGTVVMARGEGRQTQLVAYVASRRPAAEVADELRRFLRDRLPEYMRPARFVVLEEFPLLPNGKVDRRRLPDADGVAPYAPPRDETQEALASIWLEVLRKPRVGAHDSFFELGGDSLSATQVVARIGQRLNVVIELRDLFLFPTLTELARQVSRVSRSAYESVVRLPEQEDYEVSPAQRRFWIQDRLNEVDSGGTLPASFLFDGRLDEVALEASFRALVERHEILRTVFVTRGGGPRQKVLPAAEAAPRLDVSDIADAADPWAEVRAVERREALTPIDLARGPLFRAKLLRLAESRHVCVCTMHHVISDGWSAEILLEELSALYEAFVSGGAAPLAPPALQYRDYAHWLNGLLGGPRGERMKEYWLEKLGGAAALDLRPDFDDRAGREYRRSTFRFTIPRATVRRLESVGRRYGATLFMCLLASLKALFYRHTGQEDIVVGSPVAGRVHAETERQVGPYLNVVALRDDVRGGERFDALLERVRETTIDAYANQLYPLDWLFDGLGVRREPGRNPVFDVGFTLQNQRTPGNARRGTSLEISALPDVEVETRSAEALTRFWFLAEEGDDAMQMTVVYDGASFEEGTVRRLAEDLGAVVAAVAEDPGVRVNRLRLGRPAGRPAAAAKVTIELGTY